ncbi:MAG: InlB B-repeat-containing protein [Methanosarcinales archaeon]|jgi:hypothetical protein|nr:InlB B-repeat-containing protein [Methanosarcinales archaeon]
MKTKFLSYLAITAALLLLALSAPALAEPNYNSTITANWLDSAVGNDNQSIQINTEHRLVYRIHANETDLGGNYVFTVRLEHNNSEWIEPRTGFDIIGFTSEDAFPDVILNIELKNSNTEIVYTLKDPTLIQIEIFVRANAGFVYPNEVADITAGLSRHEGESLNQVAENSFMQAHALYPTMTFPAQYELFNPTIMPVGAKEIDYNYLFITDSTFNTLASSGLRLFNRGYTLDFSNVVITINGVPKTYAEWQTEADNPVTFTYSNGSPLAAGHLMTVPAPDRFVWRTPLPFKAVTNDNFTNTPSINFTGLRAYGEMSFNNRGPNVNLSPDSGEPLRTSSSGTFTGVSAFTTSVSLSRAMGGGVNIPYIVANSEQYTINETHSHLLYQELFKSFITSTARDGTSNVTITYEIPDGVTITHIRIPGSGGNIETEYGKIILVKDGVSYDLGNGGGTLDLVNGTGPNSHTGLPAFTPGENVVFEFENVLSLRGNPGGIVSYAPSHSLSFVGTTNSSVVGGTSLTFTARTDESGSVPSSFSTPATNTYYMTSVMGSRTTWLGDEGNRSVTAIEKDKPFYFYAHMSTPTYPYFSTHRTNPADPMSTGVFSSPVFYFSLPEGVRISGNDAAEIVTVTGAPTTVRDVNNNVITPRITNVWPNAGHYTNGTLVEVKLENADRPDDVFWMRAMNIRLQVYIESEYDGADRITILRQSVQLSSWDPRVIDTLSGGSGGAFRVIPDAPGKIHAGTNGTFPESLRETTLSIISTDSIRMTASVMTPLGNLTYTPGDERSYPQLRAGSLNETFRIFFSNDIEDGVFPDAEVFFILPKAVNWKPNLNTPARLSVSGFDSPGDYTIYYTTDSIDYSQIGNTAVYNRSSLSAFNWNEMTFTGSTADNTVDWENVSAIRVSMDLQGSERLELQLPFELPRVTAGSDVNYGDRARGQTMFYLNASLRHENTFTAAVMLVKSAPPVISAVNSSSPVPEAFQDATIDYLTGTIPNWFEFYTYDDFTPDLKIREVNVVFTPHVGATASYTIPGSSIANTSYMPQRPNGSGGFEDDIDFVYGFKWTIANPTNYISHGTPGVYRITYVTEEDDDLQTRSATKNITMTKNPGTISISAVNTHVIWRTDLGATVENYFRQFVTATDTETVDPSRVLLEASSPEFNISHPGNYTLRYGYTDRGNNNVNTTMIVSVLFNGTLNGTVLGNGLPVEGFVVNIDGTSATTNETGRFAHELTALVSAPTAAPYNVTFTSSVPVGLKYSGSTPITGSGSLSVPAPAANINFDAVSMTVNIAGQVGGVDSIKLYKVGSDSPIAVFDDISGNVVFSKENGLGWFEAGDYYFVADFKPGYTYGDWPSADFIAGSSVLNAKTENFALGNADITKNLAVTAAPLISGFVWNDANRDSNMDEAESKIAGATVTLYRYDVIAGSTQVQQTATNGDGFYYFVGLALDSYAVEIKPPSGFNTASALANDSTIDPETFRTAWISFLSNWHVTNINAGFYTLYTVTYDGNNADGGTVPVDSNDYLPSASAAVLGNTGNLWKAGYKFGGWTYDGTTYQAGDTIAMTEDVTLTAVWTALAVNEYLSITYNANGADGGDVPVDSYAYSPNEPATVLGNTGGLWKSGYKFDGWSYGGNTYEAGDTVIVAENVTLNAVWTALAVNEYLTVTYNANAADGGTVPSDSHSYSPNEPATVLGNTGNLWRAGFKFDGWTYNSATYQAGDAIVMVENVTLSAIWTPLATNEYLTVTYNANGADGGTVPADSHDYSPNEPATVLGNTGNLWRAGYKFDGWTYNSATYQAGDSIVMVENATLSAVWTPLAVNEYLTVTYNANGADGGTVPADSHSYSPNEPATVLGNTGNLWKAGFKFDGWTYNNAAYQAGDAIVMAENVTLSAVWTPLAANEYLAVTYNANGADGGTVPADSHDYSPNEPATVLGNTGNLWRAGYKFDGWTYNSVTYQAGDSIVMVENVTLSAVWTPLAANEYLFVTYEAVDADGGAVPEDLHAYSPNEPAQVKDNIGYLWKLDFKFDGWSDSSVTYEADDIIIMTENVTLSAVWKALEEGDYLRVIYYENGADGGTVPADSHDYSPNEPAEVLDNTGLLWKSGFKFDGWSYGGVTYEAGDFVIVSDTVTLSAVWTVLDADEYLFVTYDANGGIGNLPADSHGYSPNEPAKVLDNTDLQRSGFTFGNWSWDNEIYEADDIIIMTENVTLSAVWIPTGGGGGPGSGNATVVNPISPQPPIEDNSTTPGPDEGYETPEPPKPPQESGNMWWLWLVLLLLVLIVGGYAAYRLYKKKNQ